MYKILHIPTGELLNGVFSEDGWLKQRWIGNPPFDKPQPNFTCIQVMSLITNIRIDSGQTLGIPIYVSGELYFVSPEREFEVIWDT